MLLIAYPQLNFCFHAETGIAWLRDEDSSDTSVLFHCLSPEALARTPAEVLERIHLDIAAAYNTFGADEAEKDLPALPVSFIERPDAKPPAHLPEWFMAVRADEAPGTWIIHTGRPCFAARLDSHGVAEWVTSDLEPSPTLLAKAHAMAHRKVLPDPQLF